MAPPHHNKLRVHYRVLHPGQFMTIWVSGGRAGDTVGERRAAWLSLSRVQWVPATLEREQLQVALLTELKRAHPLADGVVLDRFTVLRNEVMLLLR